MANTHKESFAFKRLLYDLRDALRAFLTLLASEAFSSTWIVLGLLLGVFGLRLSVGVGLQRADGDRLHHQQAGYLRIKPSARAWFSQRKRCR